MPLTRSRYDGYAEWYDGWNQPHAERNAADVLDLLGPGRVCASTWAAAAATTSMLSPPPGGP